MAHPVISGLKNSTATASSRVRNSTNIPFLILRFQGHWKCSVFKFHVYIICSSLLFQSLDKTLTDDFSIAPVLWLPSKASELSNGISLLFTAINFKRFCDISENSSFTTSSSIWIAICLAHYLGKHLPCQIYYFKAGLKCTQNYIALLLLTLTYIERKLHYSVITNTNIYRELYLHKQLDKA